MGIVKEINKVKRTNIKDLIDNRVLSFEKLGKSGIKKIFSELCFCIMTANFNAERSILIQKKIEPLILNCTCNFLTKNLKICGHRFPNTRAKYIYEARAKLPLLLEKLKIIRDDNEAREWIVKNVKGLGMKEASHFLRNIGRKNCAIIDFHIIDLLVKNKIIKRPKSITKKIYLEIEEILSSLAKKLKMSLGELDLYLWYLETGKVLK